MPDVSKFQCVGTPVYNNLIKINKTILGNSYSDIYVAKIILHEMIHAYLNIKLKECNADATLPFINNLQLDELINEFYQDFNCHININGSPQSQHVFMFDYLIPVSDLILSEILDSLVSHYHQNQMESNPNAEFYNPDTNQNEPFNWNDLFYNLFLGGLHNTDVFQQEIETDNIKYQKFNHYSQIGKFMLTKDCN